MNQEFTDIHNSAKRVWWLLEPQRRKALIGALALMLVTGALANAPAVVLGRLLDRLIGAEESSFSVALPYLAVIMGCIFLREAIQIGRKYLVENTATRILKEITVRSVHHLLRLDLQFFSEHLTGSLHGRLNRSLEGFVKMLKLSFLDFFPSAFVAVFALGIAFVKAPLLGLVMLLVVPIGFIIVLKQVASQKGIRLHLLRNREAIDGAVVELLNGIENVRALNTEETETVRFSGICERLRERELVHHIWMSVFDSGKAMNEGVFHVLVLAVSIIMAIDGYISTGDVLTYSMLFLGVVTPLREVHRILDEAHESSLRVRDLFALLDLPEDRSYQVSESSNEGRSISPTAIEISGLEVRYPKTNRSTLKSLALTVPQGEFLGICGPAGCGKSTLLKVIARLIHPATGMVKVSGLELKNLSRKDVAQTIGYISQHPFLISGSVFDNIAYGKPDVSMDEVVTAARLANIHNEIMAFPDGYDFQVGERGAKLSGGQRQRVALARIFIRKPDILLLDEATSALDNLNEKAIQQAIEQTMVGKTVIAVAHRLSTLRNADRILVLDEGEIVETGTYRELLISNGLFARLHRSAEGSNDFTLKVKVA